MTTSTEVPASEPVARDDQILPPTRAVAWIIIPFLLAAFIILYVDGRHTAAWFAWEIPSRLTTALMGAGYIGGAYFFLRVGLADRRRHVHVGAGYQPESNVVLGGQTAKWHHVQAGFLPVTTFTAAMLLATLIHWDKFITTSWPFWVWLALYVVTSILIPLLWWRNKPRDPRTFDAGDRRVPLWLRMIMMAAGVSLIAVCAAAFLWPDLFITIWPWTLSPLTARVMAGFHALLGVGALVLGLERRWSGWVIPMQAISIWYVLVGAALLWHSEELGAAGLVNWYTAFVLSGLAGLAAVWLIVRARPPVAATADPLPEAG